MTNFESCLVGKDSPWRRMRAAAESAAADHCLGFVTCHRSAPIIRENRVQGVHYIGQAVDKRAVQIENDRPIHPAWRFTSAMRKLPIRWSKIM